MGALDGRGEAVAVMEDHDEKILVSVRLRPLNENEIARNDVSDWECINENTIIYKNVNLSVPERSMYPTAYTFDRVFSCDCSTRQVYEKGAKEVALSVVGGINSTVFAYGQTSSGKTYTMTGITEYTIVDIYGYIRKHKEREFQLKFSAMEIYNESVRDLLAADSTPLRLLDDPERGTVVERLTETSVLDLNHVIELLSNCEVQRQIGETSLNETSSRSHQIIKLTIESSAREFLGRDNSSTLVASVNFVDLAGSERASQSMSAGSRLKEGCHINRSLLTLGTVIRKLSMGRNGHIPFRDSKLTRILQSSLGGNARTAIICTMSPARSYIEQSRNTLLFASCAKEVTNNAQVNVVMSDRALIKHLQREVARLENELRSPRSNFVTSNFAALLQEKDLKIDKLEKEKNYLALQCDVIQSHVQDLLNMIPNSENSLIKVGSGHHSNSQVKELSECKNSVPIVPRPLGIAAKSLDMSMCLDAHIRNNSDDHNIHIPNFKENLLNNSTLPMPLTNASRFSDNYSCQGWEDIDEQSTQTYEDLCKEVRCIKTQENNGIPAPVTAASVYRVDQESIFHRYREDMKPLSPVLKEDKGFTSLTLKKDKEPVLLTSEEDGETMSHLLGSVDLSSFHSSRHDLATKVSRFRGSKLRRSRSCKASLISASYSPFFEKIESIENTPPNEFETHFFSGRHKDFERRFSALRYGASDKGLLKNVSPMGSTFDIEVDAQNVNTSKDQNISNSIIKTSIATSKEITGLQHDKHGVDRPVMESDAAKFEPIKSIKDIGLDPMEDDSRSHSNWPYEFKKLRGEIIELWCMCNVSLVHRTYFFMLFNGDPTDSIYMEVELRRLSFLRETFSHGNQTMENGRILTRASSLKALQHERLRLTKQMKKRLSEQDRESLYLKWGIHLNSKNRRLQLAHCLWTNTEDIDHITDSAIVVANLVGFIEPGQASKEMFGLNFVPRYGRRSYSLIRSFKTLLSRDTEDLNLALIP